MGKLLASARSAMSTDLQIIVDGHVELGSLRQFAETPEGFDDDAVEAIWQHLDVCEDCMKKFEKVREGRSHTPEATGESTSSSPQAKTPPPAIEPGAFNPEDLTPAKIEPQKTDGAAINGWIPVGDDPTRNGVPDEYLSETGRKTASGASDTKTEKGSSPASGASVASIVDRDERASTQPRPQNGTSGERAERIELETLTETSRAAAPEESPAVTSRPQRPREAAKARPARKDSPVRPSASEHRQPSARGPRPERSEGKKSQPASPSPTRPIPGSVRPTESEPLEELLNRFLGVLARPRNAMIAGAIVLAVVAAVVTSFVFRGGKPAPVAGWEPLSVIETRVPLQEVTVRHSLSGRIPAAQETDVTLDFSGVSRLVIAVDLSWLDRQADYYQAVVRDQTHATVFDERIPDLYLDDGRFFLRLVPKEFQDGQTYYLEILARNREGSARKIAESVFDVKK